MPRTASDQGEGPLEGDDLAAAGRRHLAIYLADRDAPCPACGYNLRGLEGARCPECGAELTLAGVKTGESAPDPFLHGVLFLLILLGATMVVASGIALVVLASGIGFSSPAYQFRLLTQGLVLLVPAAVAWAWSRWSPLLREAAPERRLGWAGAAVGASIAAAALAGAIGWMS